MVLKQCVRCGNITFNSELVYLDHMREMHGLAGGMVRVSRVVDDNTGVPRLNLVAYADQARHYTPMDPAEKQAAVTRQETAIRNAAWYDMKLNPLVGCDKVSSEPIWDDERNTVQ